MLAQEALDRQLTPDETLLWSQEQPPRRSTLGRIVAGLLVMAFMAVVIGGIIGLLWSALGPGEAVTDGPFRNVATTLPITIGVIWLALLLLTGRRILVGTPARVDAVTDRRALSVALTARDPRASAAVPHPVGRRLTRRIGSALPPIAVWRRVRVRPCRGS
ncbi:hypothetical protein ACQP1U_09875 [Actinomycetota bacterium]